MKGTIFTLAVMVIAITCPSQVIAETLFFDDFQDGEIADIYLFSGEDLPQTHAGSPEWVEEDGIFSQISTSQGDEAHAVIALDDLAGDETIQAKMRVDSWANGDSARAGVVLKIDGTGRGMNFLVHNTQSTIQFLNDQSSWGNSTGFDFEVGGWYYIQFHISEDGMLHGKIWAEGEAEPADWMLEQAHFGDPREGYPGLNGGTSPHGGSVTVSYDDVWVWDSGGPSPIGVHLLGKMAITWGKIKN